MTEREMELEERLALLQRRIADMMPFLRANLKCEDRQKMKFCRNCGEAII